MLRRVVVAIPHLLFVTFAALVVAVFATYRDVESIVVSSRWIRHTDEVLITLERVTTMLSAAESSQRGFLITNDAKYLDRSRVAREELPRSLGRMMELLADNPRQQERVGQLRVLAEAKLHEMEEVAGVRREEPFAAARTRVRDDRGFLLMKDCLAKIEEIRREERALLKARRMSQNRSFRALVWTRYVLAVLVLLFVYFLIRRKVQENRAISARSPLFRPETGVLS